MVANEDRARAKGYSAGLMGAASTPHAFMHSNKLRNAYEQGYDIGRAARKSELESM